MMGKKKTAMKRGGMAKKKTAKMRGGGMASGSREGSVINTPTAFKKGGRVKKTGPSRSLAVAKKTIEKLKEQIENMKPSSKFKARRDFLGLGGAGVAALRSRKSRPNMSDIAGRKEEGPAPGRKMPQTRPGQQAQPFEPDGGRPPQNPSPGRRPGRTRPPQRPRLAPIPRGMPVPGRRPGRRGLPSGTVIGKDGKPVPSLRASKGGRVK
tara:strand:+ start:474 stop:1100 length:627 start_codon:yes stop_codon:yes gene_type:complete